MHKKVKRGRREIRSRSLGALSIITCAAVFLFVLVSCAGTQKILKTRDTEAAVALVKSFYTAIDKGNYEAALKKLAEPERFLEDAGTEKGQIEKAFLREYGSSGEGVRIDHIEAECTGKKKDKAGRFEYSVAVSGLNGAGCVRYDWRTVFTLVKTGDTFRILSISSPRTKGDLQQWLFPERD